MTRRCRSLDGLGALLICAALVLIRLPDRGLHAPCPIPEATPPMIASRET